ncbi:MAG: hypothetical protein ACK5JU_02540 [Bacteroidales bacterium]
MYKNVYTYTPKESLVLIQRTAPFTKKVCSFLRYSVQGSRLRCTPQWEGEGLDRIKGWDERVKGSYINEESERFIRIVSMANAIKRNRNTPQEKHSGLIISRKKSNKVTRILSC